ncbi:MAG: beta-aspartyl-dipeptidase (metallo-type) [Parasphingorhabdus sp.]|jgi:beta-aspartyl-dipeptidase (metallo-type)
MFEIIANANLYSPEPEGLKHLLICAGKVVHIATDIPKLDPSLNVRHTDLEGAIVAPGFIDGHAHLTGGGGEAGFATRVPPLPISQFTHTGVTTAIGLLGTDDLTRTPQSLLAQVMSLREEGMSAWCYTGGYHIPVTTLTGSIRSDMVNLDPVIGVGELAISDHRSSQPTLDEILRIASEVHVAGLMTGKAGIVHFHLGDGQRGMSLINQCLDQSEIPARVFNPTHITRNRPLFRQACDLTKRGCYVDITAGPGGGDGWSTVEAVNVYLDNNCSMNQLTISSDGGGCLPEFDKTGQLLSMDFGRSSSLGEALIDLVNSGIKLERVLPLLTSNVSTLLRLKHKGKIAPGFDADLIVLGDQLQINSVMLGGNWHVERGVQTIRGFFEKEVIL